MKLPFWWLRAFGFVPLMCLTPDEPPGGGSGTEPSDDDVPKFSKKQMEEAINQRIAKMKKDISSKDKKVTDMEGQITELTQQIAALQQSTDADDKKKLGSLELQKQTLERQNAELNTSVTDLQNKLDAEVKKRRRMERDAEINKGLDAIKCIEEARGDALISFASRTQWDEDDERWVFSLRNGSTVSIVEGIIAEAPDYIKPASLRGGAGSTTGGSKTGKLGAQIEAAKAKVIATKKAAEDDPRNNSKVIQWNRAEKELKELLAKQNAA